jgi:hypothetical protein
MPKGVSAMIELQFEGINAVLVSPSDEPPDVVSLGADMAVFKFYKRVKPKGGFKVAGLYRRATVERFPLLQFTERNSIPG